MKYTGNSSCQRLPKIAIILGNLNKPSVSFNEHYGFESAVFVYNKVHFYGNVFNVYLQFKTFKTCIFILPLFSYTGIYMF